MFAHLINMKKIIDSIMRYAKKLNKYWAAVLVFVAITYIFGDYTLFHRIKYDREMKELRQEIKDYRDLNEENKKQIEALRSNDEVLEKYAREELLMVKPDEEVFIIKK